MNLLVALLVGAMFGALCKATGLPIPAPGALAGVVAVVGVYVGYRLAGAL